LGRSRRGKRLPPIPKGEKVGGGVIPVKEEEEELEGEKKGLS